MTGEGWLLRSTSPRFRGEGEMTAVASLFDMSIERKDARVFRAAGSFPAMTRRCAFHPPVAARGTVA